MQVILLENITRLGSLGETVKVKGGYARNYLIPKGKATVATPANIARFEERRVELEQKAAGELSAAQARAAGVEGKTITIKANAGPEGKLFGSIGTADIADACSALGADIQRSEIRMPDGPLRVVGTHEVEVHVHTDVSVSLTVVVESTESFAG